MLPDSPRSTISPSLPCSAPLFPSCQLPFSTHRLLWGNNCRTSIQKSQIFKLVTLSKRQHVEDRRGSGNLKRDVHAGWSRFTFDPQEVLGWAAPLTFPACGQLAWAALELGQRLEVGVGGGQGGKLRRRCAAATCETQVSRCSARRALVLPAGDSTTLLQLHPSRVEASPQQGGHSRKARGSCSTAGLHRTTSHPCSTETGDCQSGGGVAAISSKNIFLLSGEEKYQQLIF